MLHIPVRKGAITCNHVPWIFPQNPRTKLCNPVQNLIDVEIPFIPRRLVHVVGTAAEHPPKVGDKVQGITVQRRAAGAMRVMTPEDLGVYNKVSVVHIIQRQHMALSTAFSKCRMSLEVMFEGIDAEQAMGGIEGSGSGTVLRYSYMLLGRTI